MTSNQPSTGVFLSAEWRYLVMMNFTVDPAVVRPYVPKGTELDTYQGETYVSLVGFMFYHTKVLGWPIPFHRTFEELNLRMYVKRIVGSETRRGVVFIKEIVPKFCVAKIARWLYNENYVVHRMAHTIDVSSKVNGSGGTASGTVAGSAEYRWMVGETENRLGTRFQEEPKSLSVGSHEEFIAEHYWGYCMQRDGGTIEYQVDHPPWRIWKACDTQFCCSTEELYGANFHQVLSGSPARSTFVVEGSPVIVRRPQRIA